MADASIQIEVDTSDLLEVLHEAARIVRELGDRVPPRVLVRAKEMGRHEGGFFRIETETDSGGRVTIRVVAGHEMSCLLIDLRAAQIGA